MFLTLNLMQKRRHKIFLSISLRIFWLGQNGESLKGNYFQFFNNLTLG